MANYYSLCRSPRRFFRSLFGEIQFEEDPSYQATMNQVGEKPSSPKARPLAEMLLAQAECAYAEVLASFEALDNRRESLFKWSIGLTAASAIFGRATWTQANGWLYAAAFLLLAGILILSLSARTSDRAARPSAALLRPQIYDLHVDQTGVVDEGAALDWVARGLELARAGLRVRVNIRAAHLNAAIWALTASAIAALGYCAS